MGSYGAAQISEAEMTILYKIMPQKQWAEAKIRGIYEGSEVDKKDGFIHLSAAQQVRSTVEKHFKGQSDLLLVSVRQDCLGATLKWEVSRGGALFPHIYGALPLTATAEVVSLPLLNGVHQFPEGFPQ